MKTGNERLTTTIPWLTKMQNAFACLIGLWIMNPMAYSFYNPLILVGFILAWCILALISDTRTAFKCIQSSVFWISLLYPVTLLSLTILNHAVFEENAVIVPFIVLMFLYYSKRNKTGELRVFVSIVMTYILMIAVNSAIVLSINPVISRYLAVGDISFIEKWASPLIGNYGTVYCSVMLSLAVWGVFLDQKRIGHKMPAGIALVILFIFLIRAQYTIALLLLIQGLLTIKCTSFKRRSVRYLFVLMLCIIIVIILIYGIGPIFIDLAGWFPKNTPFSARLFQISEFFMDNNGPSEGNGAIMRLELYERSLKTFMQNPLLGVGDKAVKMEDMMLVGNHSEILDIFAKYGILGGGTFLFSRYVPFFAVYKYLIGRYKMIYIHIVITFSFLSIINTTGRNEFMFTMLLIIPFLLTGFAPRSALTTKQ